MTQHQSTPKPSGIWILAVLALTACHSTVAPPRAPNLGGPLAPPTVTTTGLRLLSLEVPVGISEPLIQKWVDANLDTLADCIRLGVIEEGSDDRVEVTASIGGLPNEPVHASVSTVAADPKCIENVVGNWAQQDGVHGTFMFRYRMPPTSAAQRTAFLARARAGLAQVCLSTARDKVTAKTLKAAVITAAGDLPLRLRMEITKTLSALDHVSPDVADQILISALSDMGDEYRETSCAGPDERALLATPSIPRDLNCQARVRQLKELPAPIVAPSTAADDLALWVSRVRPALEPGLQVAAGLMCSSDGLCLRSPTKDVQAALVRERKSQRRERPIVYVSVGPEVRVGDFVTNSKRWSTDFELRLWLPGGNFEAGALTKTAWPEALNAMTTRVVSVPFNEVVSALTTRFDGDEPYCKGIGAVAGAALRGRELGGRVALALESCGCPAPYSELAWARVALISERSNGRVGWVPVSITDSPKALLIKGLNPEQPISALLAELERGGWQMPVRIELKAARQ